MTGHFLWKNISVIAINTDKVEEHPEDRPEIMKEKAEKLTYLFPYLYEGKKETTKAYEAARTPGFYFFDADMKLVCCGRLADFTPGNNKPSGCRDLRQALDLLLEGKSLPDEEQYASIGCSIKWKDQ